MDLEFPILNIEFAPGDAPRAVEQVNGDLLLPAACRPTLEQALLMAEDVLDEGHENERAALAAARRLLGVERVDREMQTVQANLLKVAAI